MDPNQISIYNGEFQQRVFRIIFFFEKVNYKVFQLYCMNKFKITIIKNKDTTIINIHHQICSKHFELSHVSIGHAYSYHEDHSDWETYYSDL